MTIQIEIPTTDGPRSPHDTHFDAVFDALERLEGSGPEFGGFLSNHGPMAADSLSRLGAAPDHVAFWVDMYRTQLEAAPGDFGRVTRTNWHQHLGDVRRLGDWIGQFDREIREFGWRDVVATWWPRLLPGAAAGASHGLIRTAHAIRSLAETQADNELLRHELAQGLGYWATRYQPVPGTPTLAGGRNARQALAALPRLAPNVPSAGPGFSGRFTSLVALRELPDALDGWRADDLHDSFDELISAAARFLANRDDAPLALCHAVTAPAAVHMVVDQLPATLRRASLAASWQIVGAIIAGFGFPASEGDFAEVESCGPETPTELADAAIEHGDDHVIKLTEAALRQHARTGDSILLTAASRFRSRVPRPEMLL